MGIEYYNENYQHWVSSYQRFRKRGEEYWLHLERISENQIKSEVIGFLNDWLCRVDHKSAISLGQILTILPPLYEVLKEEAIENIDFNELKVVEQQHLSNSDIIKKVMKCFLKVRPKFGPVAASKLMHMAIPRLFVMWDTGIRTKYRIPTYYATNHARNYVNFLKLMQLQIRHAIDSYVKAYSVNTQTAIQQVRKEDNNSSIARIVDKYNFAVRDGKLRICAECYNRWLR